MSPSTIQPRVQEITVAEVMTRDVVTIRPEHTLRDLLTLLTDARVTGVPVVEGDEVAGVVSVRDLLDFEAAHGVDGSGGVGETAWEPADDEAELPGAFFLEEDERALDVVDHFEAARTGTRDLLACHTVAEVMTRGLASVEAHALLREAAGRMVRERVHRLLVLDGRRLVGIVTTSDVVRAVALYG
jgi:CBS domain-containing protein